MVKAAAMAAFHFTVFCAGHGRSIYFADRIEPAALEAPVTDGSYPEQ